jgi:universal stress protein A
MLDIRTILHPTGFFKVDQAAFCLAGSLARTYRARLVILHVMKPWYLYGRARLLGTYLHHKLERWEAVSQVRVADLDLPLEHRLTEGEPVSAILSVAKELSCDLIVMGTHKRSGLRRLLKGSTAEAVVRRAPCPVLIVGASLAKRSRLAERCCEASIELEQRITELPGGYGEPDISVDVSSVRGRRRSRHRGTTRARAESCRGGRSDQAEMSCLGLGEA